MIHERGNPNYDTTHRVTADIIYELPGLSNMTAPVRTVLGGWQMSAIYSGSTGSPVRVTQGCSNAWACRGDYLGGDIVLENSPAFNTPVTGRHTFVRYINPAAFAKVPEVGGVAIRPGNAANGIVRGPGQWTIDFSLSKRFAFTEAAGLQIRADMFNFFNHVNLGGINGNVESSDFGVIDSAGGMRTMQVGARITF